MTLEIERKFICNLTYEQVKTMTTLSRKIHSIYILNTKKESFRVVKDTHPKGSIICKYTNKQTIEGLLARSEKEDFIPEILFNTIESQQKYPAIKKERFLIKVDGYVWEVDFFEDYDFVIAELEFETEEEALAFNNFPSWIGKEVTEDPTYLNCNLAK